MSDGSHMNTVFPAKVVTVLFWAESKMQSCKEGLLKITWLLVDVGAPSAHMEAQV